MSTATGATPASGRLALTRAAAFLRSEPGVVALALAAVALHVLDDNYLEPTPGTSAADHLASGLTPLAVLIIAAALYSRLRPGLRASLAMTLGAIAITFGVPGAYYLRHGSASGDHYSGLLAIVAGAVLLLSGSMTLWRARRTEGQSTAALRATDGHGRYSAPRRPCRADVRHFPRRLCVHLHAHGTDRCDSGSRSAV